MTHSYKTNVRDNCEERINDRYDYVASRIRWFDTRSGRRFLPYYVSNGEEHYYSGDGGVGFLTIEEARSVLSTYAQ